MTQTFGDDDECTADDVDTIYKLSTESAQDVVSVLAGVVDEFQTTQFAAEHDIKSVQSMVRRRLTAFNKESFKLLESVTDDIWVRFAGLIADSGSALAQIRHEIAVTVSYDDTESLSPPGSELLAETEIPLDSPIRAEGASYAIFPRVGESAQAFVERVVRARQERARQRQSQPETGERSRDLDLTRRVEIPTEDVAPEQIPHLPSPQPEQIPHLPVPAPAAPAVFQLPTTIEGLLQCICAHLDAIRPISPIGDNPPNVDVPPYDDPTYTILDDEWD